MKGYDEDGRSRRISESRWLMRIGILPFQRPIPSEPECRTVLSKYLPFACVKG